MEINHLRVISRVFCSNVYLIRGFLFIILIGYKFEQNTREMMLLLEIRRSYYGPFKYTQHNNTIKTIHHSIFVVSNMVDARLFIWLLNKNYALSHEYFVEIFVRKN